MTKVVAVSDEVYTSLKKFCDENGLKIKAVVDRAITTYLKKVKM